MAGFAFLGAYVNGLGPLMFSSATDSFLVGSWEVLAKAAREASARPAIIRLLWNFAMNVSNEGLGMSNKQDYGVFLSLVPHFRSIL